MVIRMGMVTKARVLLAEDDSAQREILQELLELEGYQVRVSTCSNELIAGLADSPDAVLMDVVGVASTEVRRALGALRPRPAVLVVSGQPKLNEVAHWLGADAFVCKPFDVSELLDALESALRKRPSPVDGAQELTA
ncbi:MAG: response regulator [Myxococcota bacterium]|nr:response regulator [Myxococcota bacterium]